MIETELPIEAPGGFAPVFAIGQDDGSGNLALVSPLSPLPTVAHAPSVPAPLEGSTSTAAIAGPFQPAPLAPIYLTLSGDWEGTVQVLRSFDGGATKHGLTIAGTPWANFSSNASEPVWIESESDAALYLELAPSSGTIDYRVSQ